MYAILEIYLNFLRIHSKARNAHMFVHIHHVRLLCEIVRPDDSPSSSVLVCFLASVVSKEEDLIQRTSLYILIFIHRCSCSSTGSTFLQ